MHALYPSLLSIYKVLWSLVSDTSNKDDEEDVPTSFPAKMQVAERTRVAYAEELKSTGGCSSGYSWGRTQGAPGGVCRGGAQEVRDPRVFSWPPLVPGAAGPGSGGVQVQPGLEAVHPLRRGHLPRHPPLCRGSAREEDLVVLLRVGKNTEYLCREREIFVY